MTFAGKVLVKPGLWTPSKIGIGQELVTLSERLPRLWALSWCCSDFVIWMPMKPGKRPPGSFVCKACSEGMWSGTMDERDRTGRNSGFDLTADRFPWRDCSRWAGVWLDVPAVDVDIDVEW